MKLLILLVGAQLAYAQYGNIPNRKIARPLPDSVNEIIPQDNPQDHGLNGLAPSIGVHPLNKATNFWWSGPNSPFKPGSPEGSAGNPASYPQGGQPGHGPAAGCPPGGCGAPPPCTNGQTQGCTSQQPVNPPFLGQGGYGPQPGSRPPVPGNQQGNPPPSSSQPNNPPIDLSSNPFFSNLPQKPQTQPDSCNSQDSFCVPPQTCYNGVISDNDQNLQYKYQKGPCSGGYVCCKAGQPGSQQPGNQFPGNQQQPGQYPGNQQQPGSQFPGNQQQPGSQFPGNQQQPGQYPGNQQQPGSQKPGKQPGSYFPQQQPGNQLSGNQQPGQFPNQQQPGQFPNQQQPGNQLPGNQQPGQFPNQQQPGQYPNQQQPGNQYPGNQQQPQPGSQYPGYQPKPASQSPSQQPGSNFPGNQPQQGNQFPSQSGVQFPNNQPQPQYPSKQPTQGTYSPKPGSQYPQGGSQQPTNQYPGTYPGSQNPSAQPGSSFPGGRPGSEFPGTQPGTQFPGTQPGTQFPGAQPGSYPGSRPSYVTDSPVNKYTGPINEEIPSECAAALKCVAEIYCTAEGVMSDTPVQLTREQQTNKVPLTDCKDVQTGLVGKCCRDPNYKDPWPAGMMMAKGQSPFDDGSYKGDNNPNFDDGQYRPEHQQPGSQAGYQPGPQPGYQPAPQPGYQLPTSLPGRTIKKPLGVFNMNVTPFPAIVKPQPGQTHSQVFPQNEDKLASNPSQFPNPSQSAAATPGQYGSGSASLVPSGQNPSQPGTFPQSSYGSQPRPQQPDSPQPNSPSYGSQKPFPPPFPGSKGTNPGTQPSSQQPTSSFPQQQPGSSSFPQQQPSPSVFPQQQPGPSQPNTPSYGSQKPFPPPFPGSKGQPSSSSFPQQQPGSPSFPQQQPGSPSFPQQQPGSPSFPQQQPGSSSFPQQQPGSPSFPQQQPGSPYFPQQQPGSPSFPQQQPGSPSSPQQPGSSQYPQPQPSSPSSPGQSFPPPFPGSAPLTPHHTSPQQPSQVIPGEECGVRRPPFTDNVDADTANGEFPWQAIVLSSNNRSALCSGAIISDNAILTSAHCLEGFEAKDLQVKVGSWKLNEPGKTQMSNVAAIVPHPSYDSGSLVKDQAVLVLEQPIVFDQNVDKVCLPPADNEHYTQNGKTCYVTGYGRPNLQGGLPGTVLHKIEVNLIPNNQCENTLRQTYLGKFFILNEGFTCAQPKYGDFCKVDIGSPLVCDKGDGHYELAGIYSWDTQCSSQAPAVLSECDSRWTQQVLNTPVNTLKAQQQSKPKVESSRPEDIDQKPGFALGYGK